ncbi:maleylacetoacetate isomerase [Halomonas sp. E19]|uniref:maleylacetoacetate isomerase n=1 Tax=Halomonas sp. E19 TaxID=3397247 RepID=UPI0040336A9A
MTTLYGYFRSSAAYRVRIALNLKGLAYEQVAVNLVKGEQRAEENLARNPQGLVPVLETDDGTRLTQSLAICEYLEERHREPALLPGDPSGRARVRSLAQLVACEIHPLNNLKVLKYLVHELKLDEAAKLAWYRHWIAEGFTALEARLAGEAATGAFCHGDSPSLADVCLVPQVFNAERFECDLSAYPTIRRIAERCRAMEAFAKAAPGEQPDAG